MLINVFFPPYLPADNTFLFRLIFVLTNNFLQLRSFSMTIQIFVSKASLANLADLAANLAIVFFNKKSIPFLAFCVQPGRTKQHFCFGFAFGWDSEKGEINSHCKKYFEQCFAIFLMEKVRQLDEKSNLTFS